MLPTNIWLEAFYLSLITTLYIYIYIYTYIYIDIYDFFLSIMDVCMNVYMCSFHLFGYLYLAFDLEGIKAGFFFFLFFYFTFFFYFIFNIFIEI